jgi:soluble lytic murein transglycosylase
VRCAWVEPEEAWRTFLGLLAEDDVHDEPEREAAERLARAFDGADRRPTTHVAKALGLAFHQHRDFDRAIRYLSMALPDRGEPLPENKFETAYARVRSFFWQERYEEAAMGYAWLAAATGNTERRARAHYQVARCYELLGRQRQALEAYRAAYRAHPAGRFADAALFSMLRLYMVLGYEDEATGLFDQIAAQRSWRETTARAGLFLAASDLVRGRADRAGGWLSAVERADRDAALEVDYWRGRLAELQEQPARAVSHYLDVLERDLFHPLAVAARQRLAQPNVAPAAKERGAALAGSDRSADLYHAWLLLGGEDPRGRRAHERLLRRLAAGGSTAAWVSLEPVPVERWPLWRTDTDEPEEMLVALGIWDHAVETLTDAFPLSDPDLAMTGGLLLAESGQIRQAILRAELMGRRVPAAVPEPFLPVIYRKLLHPLAYGPILLDAGRRFGVDPLLVAAVIREESRYDPRALSAASARGLTQFVMPTALRVAGEIGFGAVSPEDLYRPEVSIPLGAAYLAELSRAFQGAPEAAVAAYNAGPPQARVWRTYTMSSEPEEYFTKVGFTETRGYLRKVLSSWARYHDLYELPPEVPAPPQMSKNNGG